MGEPNIIECMPAHKMDSYYRWILKSVEEYFKDEEVQARYQKWLAEKNSGRKLECDVT